MAVTVGRCFQAKGETSSCFPWQILKRPVWLDERKKVVIDESREAAGMQMTSGFWVRLLKGQKKTSQGTIPVIQIKDADGSEKGGSCQGNEKWIYFDDRSNKICKCIGHGI